MRALPIIMFPAWLMTTAAFAATVQTVEGQVAINRGNGFEYGPPNTTAKAGDLVMVTPNGLGRIVYDDGCAVDVKPGQIVSVREASPCKTGLGLTRTHYVIGGAVIAGVTVGIIALANDNDDDHNKPKPASP